MIRPTLYGIILSLHIVSIVAWMAGILYLYRLFIYHVEDTELVVKKRFQIMESRLYRIITVPAMVASFVFGGSLLFFRPDFLSQPWLHAKLLMVGGMMFMTLFGGHQIDELADGKTPYSSRTYRILNEVPTLLLLFIVLLVVLKPFAR